MYYDVYNDKIIIYHEINVKKKKTINRFEWYLFINYNKKHTNSISNLNYHNFTLSRYLTKEKLDNFSELFINIINISKEWLYS